VKRPRVPPHADGKPAWTTNLASEVVWPNGVAGAADSKLYQRQVMAPLLSERSGNAQVQVQTGVSMSEPRIWNEKVDKRNYDSAGEKYQAAILEQYKLAVEIGDRFNTRRLQTNAFFLTLNSAVVAVLGIFWASAQSAGPWLLLPILLVALGQCFVWYQSLNRYDNLSRSLHKVIPVLEEQLPSRAYSCALNLVEQGGGGRWLRHGAYSLWEKSIPPLLAVSYTAAFLLKIFSS
jgi:hypothetical protein